MTDRIFTIQEVDSLIPTLAELVERQLGLQADIERRLAELSRAGVTLSGSIEPKTSDSHEVASLKRELKGVVTRYEAGWREVQTLGAVVKDPQIGLLDFRGCIDGRLVWFCWRYGEEALGFYHELEAGFAGRRPLEAETRAKLLN
jgi:hypothetical protein